MRILGMISGTSADGIDVAIADIHHLAPAQIAVVQSASSAQTSSLQIEQRWFKTFPWSQEDRALIFRLFSGEATVVEVCRGNFHLGNRFAEVALEAIAASGMQPNDIDAIGSHGQTIWHDIDDQGQAVSTLQIGEPAVIAERTGITTVADFRVADVAAGGQGAPLVSILDWHLLRPSTSLNGVANGWRAVQNIGGIGNVTFLPPVGSDKAPLAFDTGPGNALMDWATEMATEGAQSYDVDGRIGIQGQPNEDAVEEILQHPYFQRRPPKTTGRELFTLQLAKRWATEYSLVGADCVATMTELTAASIADAYARWAPGPIAQVVIAGGGARNPYLMKRLRANLARYLPQNSAHASAQWLVPHEQLGIDSDAKEALAFALLTYLALTKQPGNVPACTGAAGQRILGKITPALA